MAITGARSAVTKKSGILNSFKDIIFSTKGLPLVLVLTVLSVLFVLFRMKSVELDYKLSEVSKKISVVESEKKDLQAKKAKLLSNKNLRALGKKHNLSEPKQNQIIIIPDK